ncbi:EmrB/QacA subfamily drug resistance transporter [Actinomadura algeriensis]|uniref:EmrB/QacA subfamily drug resistance transporter n=2 Tax=Actinomadura algeriensis TaxID=1679523 RepID=A0ABR9JPX3_9ACTN|nr:EmrB/QacA subfamily drug resistance transporter [Actinomadura algeriensis]
MDNTVVFTATPTIQDDLRMSDSATEWIATGYILMFSCLMIAGGRLTDIHGCRVVFSTGMIVFTAASAVCGLAQSSDVLILARIVQGAGAALALPATQVMVTVGRNDKQRSIGNIVWIGAASSATAFGPTIGGVIVQHWTWHWIFLINIVPGIVVILLGMFLLTGEGQNKDARVDLPGVLISATMLFALIYALEAGPDHGWTDPSVLSVFALGLIALVCFVMVESWAPDPMMDLRFFRNRVFTGGLLSQMLYGIGFNGMMFYSQPFLQRYLGFSPPEAGLVMLPPAITIMVLTPIAFLLAAKIGSRPAIGGGMALMGVGMFLFSTLEVGDGYADLMPGVMLVGVGAALGMPLVMYVLKAVPEQQAGVASGVINVIREASGAFGIAIVGLLVHSIPKQDASPAELESFGSGTSSGLILGAALVVFGGVIGALTLPSRRGWLGPKHGKQRPLVSDPPPRDRPAHVPADATAVHATSPDPVPVGAAVASAASPSATIPDDLAVATAAASGAGPADTPETPSPLASPRKDESMPDPTPGPHWWNDWDEPGSGTGPATEKPPPTPSAWPPPPSAAPSAAPPAEPPAEPPAAPPAGEPAAPSVPAGDVWYDRPGTVRDGLSLGLADPAGGRRTPPPPEGWYQPYAPSDDPPPAPPAPPPGPREDAW